MDTYGDHLLYCEGGPLRIWRHDAQVKLLARDLAKAVRRPVVEERPVGRHRERPDIRAPGRCGGTELFDFTIRHRQSGKDPGSGTNPTEYVEGGMDRQIFPIRGYALGSRNRAQPATCPIVNTGLAAVLLPGTSLPARSKVYTASMCRCTWYLWRPFTVL